MKTLFSAVSNAFKSFKGPSEPNFLVNGQRVKPQGFEGSEWLEMSHEEYVTAHRKAQGAVQFMGIGALMAELEGPQEPDFLVNGRRVKPNGYEGSEWLDMSKEEYVKAHLAAKNGHCG